MWKGSSVLRPVDLVLAERADHPRGGLLPIGVPDDQLGHHRVVHRARSPSPARRPSRRARRGRRAPGRRRSSPGAGAKFLLASSALIRHSIAWPRSSRSSWAIESGSPAATRMPSLTMSIPVTISVTQCSTWTRVFISRKKYSPLLEQPLDRPRAGVVDRRRGLGGDLADPGPQLLVHGRRRRLLDQLLVAALQRAVALAEVDHVAVLVGQHLHLDVTGVGQVALEVDGGVAEELLALPGRALEGVLQLVLGQGDAEALAAAAPRRLDGHRIADRLRRSPCARPRSSSTGSVVPGTIGTPALAISSRARVLDPIASIADEGGPMNTIPRPRAPWRRRRSRPGSRSPDGPPRRRSARSPPAASRSTR